MKDERKTKKQLIDETAKARKRVAKLEKSEARRKQAEGEISRQAAVLDAINRVFQDALTCETEEELGKTCLAVAEELTGSKFGFFGVINPAGLLDDIAISNPGWDACEMAVSDARKYVKDMPIRGIDRSTIREEKSRIVNEDEMATHPDRVGTPEGHPRVTAFLGVPLKHEGKTIGMIGLGNKKGGYDMADQEAVENLAVAIVEALRSKRAEEERKQAENRLGKETKAVGAILSNILLGELDDAEAEMQVMNACMDATDSIYGMIGVVNKHGKYDTTTYSSRTMQDCAFPEALAWELSTGMAIRGIWGRPMLRGEPVLCNDLPAHPDRVGYPEGHVAIDCYLGVPLKDGEKVVGMISVANKPGGYTEDDKEALVRLASVVDISRQRRQAELSLRNAREELVRKERLAVLGLLSGGVGHELRNPLGVISNAVYYLKMVLTEADEKTREYLDIISSEVGNAEKIVSDLLDFSRTKPAEREEVAVADLIARALERKPPPEGVAVTTEIAPDLPTVHVDSRQMEQVFVNLASNACHAMPEGGGLTIRAKEDEGKVRITVTDTGCGMSEKLLEKAFEPLYTTKARGIGLGLSVSKSLVELNGGSIEAESEEGKGSTFTVILSVKEVQS